MKQLWHDYMNNSKRWEKNSDEWVKAMHESRRKKERKREAICDHGDLEWCENCLTTEDGEELEPV